MKMNKIAGAMVALSMFAGPMLASAQTSTTTSTNVQIQAMLSQIQALQAQIQALQSAQTQLETAKSNVKSTLGLIRNLRQGMSGDDVSALQAILAADPTIYPEGTVTGFYGRLTAEAVKKFQKKNGFEQVGFVGPKTLKKLNEHFEKLGLTFEISSSTGSTTTIVITNNGGNGNSHDDDDDDGDDDNKGKGKKLCVNVPPGHFVAPGWIKKNGKPIIPECQKLPKGIKDKIDWNWNNGTTTQDTVAPVISSITNVPGVTNTTVYWTTNENSTTKVYYGTTSSIDANATTTLSVSNGSLVTNHGITITGLTGSTLYYYVVESKDSKGNKSVSAVNSFTTTAVPDTTAPIISIVGTSNLLGTTTSIVWTTNEASNSKVWFGTSSPVSTSGTANITNASMVTSHSIPLTGLSTSTTYYFVVGSSDSIGNTSTSSQGSFVTTAGL